MNKLESFENYPMTASSPEFLAAVYYRGAGINAFSDSLPRGARVADVGAGLSTLGIAVAKRRADIQWVNFDINYNRIHHVSRAALVQTVLSAPNNVWYTAGSILAPDALEGTFDRIYSYNLVPHLLRADKQRGRLAVRNMVDLLKHDGLLTVGPKRPTADPTEHMVCELDSWATEEHIDEAVAQMTTSRLANFYHDAVWPSGVAIYPAPRFNPETRHRYVLSDDGGQTAHPIFSRTGLRLAGRLAGGVFLSLKD